MFALIFLGLIAVGWLIFAIKLAFQHKYEQAFAAVVFGGLFAFITFALTDAYVADIPSKCEDAGGVMVDGTCIQKETVIRI